jgi:hypothetical protein
VHEETWRIEGERFADSFNPRRAIISDRGRLGYLKVLSDGTSADPWTEQWANEQIFSELSESLGLPCIEARAGHVEGEAGAITVFMEGRKISELEQAGFQIAPVLEAALNRDQFGLVVALDLWLLNVDRGAHNLFITTEEGRPRVRLIDHGHTLLLPRTDKRAEPPPEDWEAFVLSGVLDDAEMTRRIIEGSYLRPYVTPEEIKAGARTIAQVRDDHIDEIVDAVPDEFLHAPPQAISTLLKHRRSAIPRSLEEVL